MNILFLSLINYKSIEDRDIYTDLLREFRKKGNDIYIVTAAEKREKVKTHVINENHCRILRVRTGNIQKTNMIEKGISTLLLEQQFVSAINKYFRNTVFDLILYATPPITIVKAIQYIKRKDNAFTYLMLKDIFPQNAVDIGIIRKNGALFQFFRKKEKRLYAISDYIGCMSQANVEYIKAHNKEIKREKIGLSPNSIDVIDMSVSKEKRNTIRKKYGIPLDKIVFVYGGNLGKPQGIEFLIKCIKSQKNNRDVFFLVVGDGTEFSQIEKYYIQSKQKNFCLMKWLNREDYDTMLGGCDVGLIFLDCHFTIPNFPSRIVSYMQAKIPIFACTDVNTDIGKIILEGEFGWWCESNNENAFSKMVEIIIKENIKKKGLNGYNYLNTHWSVKKQANDILDIYKKYKGR